MSEYLETRNSYNLNEALDKAINCFNPCFEEGEKILVKNFLRKQFKCLNCCILSIHSTPFKKFLADHVIPCDLSKIVIIGSNYSVRYSISTTVEPHIII